MSTLDSWSKLRNTSGGKNLRTVAFCSTVTIDKLECGPMPNVMAALSDIHGAVCSTPLSLADAHY